MTYWSYGMAGNVWMKGLLFFGNVIIPFVDHFPKDTLLYSVLTTRPDEIAGTKA